MPDVDEHLVEEHAGAIVPDVDEHLVQEHAGIYFRRHVKKRNPWEKRKQTNKQSLSILMFLTPRAEVTP